MAKQKSTTAKGILLEVGQKAIEFQLDDQNEKTHRLADDREKWVVLYFYPKDDTPGCTTQACQFRDQIDPITNHHAVVLGVSPDGSASHEKFAAKFGLPFDLLADPDQKVCGQYGVWQQKSMYGRKYMGVVRTTYLIDPQGRIAHRWDKVKVKTHATDVLAVLDEQTAAPG